MVGLNILVTGAAGALGRNLIENLKCIRDGKNRTRPHLVINEIYEYDRENTLDDLKEYCNKCTFVVHAAGVNRPINQMEFMTGNYEFTQTLLDTLKQCNNKSPVVLTSSVQATLSGRFGDSEYGRSKLAGEEALFRYGDEKGIPVFVYRFPNMVGKWIRPHYNSAVATFCYCIAREEPVAVDNPATKLEMAFFDDICEELYDCMEGHPHRCEYPAKGEVVEAVEYDGVTARWLENGRYCGCPVTYRATLGTILHMLKKFHRQPQTIMMPDLTSGGFEKKLYAMYLSYLPKEKAIFDIKMNCDDRGSFTELMRTINAGQVSVNISKPGITKGEHWHLSKNEQFIVVKGSALIRMRKIGTEEIWEFKVSGDKIQSVFMIPGYTHSIKNLSDTDDLVTIIIASESFNPERPDTYSEKV